MIWSFSILGALAIVTIGWWLWSRNAKTKKQSQVTEEMMAKLRLFSITLPQEKREEEARKDLKALLAPAEVLFNNLYSIINFNPDAYLVLEIVASHGQVQFYAAVPEDVISLFEKQLTSQYPFASVEKVDDYNIFPQSGKIAAAELTLNQSEIYPIKTFQQMEIDPMEAIANAFSHLEENEGAAIQLLIKPTSDTWHKEGQDLARKMQQGKKSGGGNIVSDIAGGVGKGLLGFTSIKDETKKEDDAGQRLTTAQEEVVKALEEKASQHGFATSIRIITAGRDELLAKQHLNNIIGAFAQFDLPSLNGFRVAINTTVSKIIARFIFRFFEGMSRPFILTPREIATLFHLPGGHLSASNIKRLNARQLPPPNNLPTEGVIIGRSMHRGVEKIVRIKDDDRRRHFYEIGKTGTGKTTWMQNMVYQDIMDGKGVCVIDPHGEMINWLLERIPKERVDDVIHFYPPDTDRPLGLNLLEAKTDMEKDLAVSEMIAIFTQMFDAEIVGPMFEHYMRNAMLALLADSASGATLVEIPRMFVDDKFRAEKVAKVTNPVIRDFWTKEYEQSRKGQAAYDMLSYVISKLGRFISNDTMRNIIGQTHSAFNIRQVMDEGKILLVNLSKGLIGEMNSDLLGFILVSKIQMAALSRADMPEKDRKDFYLYIDEFQNVTTPSIATILSEARKYKLNLVVAHQFMEQLDEKIRNAVLGNVGTMMAFTVGPDDAEILAKQFAPEVTTQDLINIENRNAYLKLMINGATSPSFNIQTLPPMGEARPRVREGLVELSRLKYGKDKRLVDVEIRQRGAIVTEFKL